jgi:hypothetical protein
MLDHIQDLQCEEPTAVTDGRERRCHPRHRLVQPATIRTLDGDRQEPCVVLDISESGARLHLHSQPSEVRNVQVCFLRSDRTVDCRVVWCKACEIGVCFERQTTTPSVAGDCNRG